MVRLRTRKGTVMSKGLTEDHLSGKCCDGYRGKLLAVTE